MIRLAVSGSRSILNAAKYIELALDEYMIHIKDVILIVGDAGGVDSSALDWANQNGIKTIVLKPANKYFPFLYKNLGRWGNKLYHARNMQVVDNCDFLIAIWDGESSGTKQTFDYAQKIGKFYKVIQP